MKISSGPALISGKLIFRAASSLVQSLKFIIIKSFEQGKFPSTLKVSKTVPLHKKAHMNPLTITDKTEKTNITDIKKFEMTWRRRRTTL